MYTHKPTRYSGLYCGQEQVEAVKAVVGVALKQKFAYNNPATGMDGTGARAKGNAIKWWFEDKEWDDIPALIIVAKAVLFDEMKLSHSVLDNWNVKVVPCSKRSRHPGFRVLVLPQ